MTRNLSDPFWTNYTEIDESSEQAPAEELFRAAVPQGGLSHLKIPSRHSSALAGRRTRGGHFASLIVGDDVDRTHRRSSFFASP